MATPEQFMIAMEDESYRQEFIDSIDLEDARPFVSEVIYRPKLDLIAKSDSSLGVMRYNVPSVRCLLGLPIIKSKIVTYPLAFSTEFHLNLDDFLSSLIDHEGFHARQYAQNRSSQLSPLDSLQAIVQHMAGKVPTGFIKKKVSVEQACLYNQIQNFPRRNCSEKYKQLVHKWHEINRNILRI